jgi:hypothetical protein
MKLLFCRLTRKDEGPRQRYWAGSAARIHPRERFDGVYLGADIHPKVRSRVLACVADYAAQAEVHQAFFHPNEFALRFERIA